MNSLFEVFTYDFFFRAFIVGVMVSVCAALLGVCLILKKYSMIGDGLSHVGFGSLALATVLNFSPFFVSVPLVTIASLLLLKIKSSSKIKGDSAIALISSGSLAVGIMLISVGKGVNININNYMFGSILSLSNFDTVLSVILCVVVIILYALFYNRIFAVTFDETFAKATGTNAEFYNVLLAVLTSVTIVLGMRMMGALLISSLTIFPAITAMQSFKKFKSVIIASTVISVLCFTIGIFASFLFETPTGATIVISNIIMLFFFMIINKLKRVG